MEWIFLIFIFSILYLSNSLKFTWLMGDKNADGSCITNGFNVYHSDNIPSSRYNYFREKLNDDEYVVFGGALEDLGIYEYRNDLWMYNNRVKKWKHLKGKCNSVNDLGIVVESGVFNETNLPSARYHHVGWKYDNSFFIYGGYGYGIFNEYGYLFDLWELKMDWDPIMNISAFRHVRGVLSSNRSMYMHPSYGESLVYKASNHPGGLRYTSTVSQFKMGGLGLLFGGFNDDGFFSDMWYFNASSTYFTHAKGPKMVDARATVVQKGVYHENNTIFGIGGATMVKINGDEVLIFGGLSYDEMHTQELRNDVWKYSFSLNMFQHCFGDLTKDLDSYIEKPYVYNTNNRPGGRFIVHSVRYEENEVLFFGGKGFGLEAGNVGIMSDFWIYDFNENMFKFAGGSINVDGAPIYNAKGVFNKTSIIGGRKSIQGWWEADKSLILFGGVGHTFDHPDVGYSTNEMWRVEFTPECNPICQSHGKCVSDDVCDCNDESIYSGIWCDEWTCFGYEKRNKTGCSNHGDCEDYDKCKCAFGYSEKNCSFFTCNEIALNHSKACNGRGRCVERNKCECDFFAPGYKYEGDDCEFRRATPEEITRDVLIVMAIVIPIVLLVIIIIIAVSIFIGVKWGKKILIVLKIKDEEVMMILAEQNAEDGPSINARKLGMSRREMQKKIVKGDVIYEGNTSKIVEATWSGRTVAYKSVPIDVKDKETTDEFSQDIDFFMQKKNYHDYIMKILGVFPEKEAMGLILEYCSHGNLLQFITKQKQVINNQEVRYHFNEKIRILIQLCMAVEFLHSKDIVLGNISHKDVLIDQHMNAKLKGFGIALLEKKKECHYAAPEVLKNPLSAKKHSDIYSLGMLTYALFSEKFCPFGRDVDDKAIKRKVLEENERPKINPADFHENSYLINLIKKCWDVDPSKRGTIGEVFKGFRKILKKCKVKKLAFVLGNCKYKSLTELPSSKNDAVEIAKLLQKMDFRTTLVEDQGIEVLLKNFAKFCEKREKEFKKNKYNDILTIFYYSGHGVVSAEKFLCLPVDFKKVYFKQPDFLDKTLTLGDIKSSFASSRRGKNIIFLDCCRTAAGGSKVNMTRKGETSKNLWRAKIKSNIPENSNFLVCYSTDPERPALDSYFENEKKSINSPYTSSLLEALVQKNENILEICKKVKNEVRQKTKFQNPWYKPTLTESLIWNREEMDLDYDDDSDSEEEEEGEKEGLLSPSSIVIEEKKKIIKIKGKYLKQDVLFMFNTEKATMKVGGDLLIKFSDVTGMVRKKDTDGSYYKVSTEDDDDNVVHYKFYFDDEESEDFKFHSSEMLKKAEDLESDEDEGETEEEEMGDQRR